MSISIIIPCYEMNGKGTMFLRQLLQTINKQTVRKEIEVVVSDDTETNDIQGVCKEFVDLNIQHVFNRSKIKNFANNCNNGIRNSTNDYIKPICQDDFFVREDAIEIFLEHKSSWCASGCIHYNDNDKQFTTSMLPYYQENIIRGINTISAPSSIAFIKQSGYYFDDTLAWYMDCELYFRLNNRAPLHIIPEILIGNRQWSGQVTHTRISDDIIRQEEQYINKKYDQTIFI